MKKAFYSFIGAIVCLLVFSSCDTNFLTQLLGNASVTISDPTSSTYYGDSTKIEFSSSLTDIVAADSNVAWSNLALCANIDLTTANAITPPYLGITTTDTACQSYAVVCPVSFDSLAGFNAEGLLSHSCGHNLFVLAASDTCWYLGRSGNIVISSFPAYGNLMEGTLNQVQAFYITQSKLDYLTDLTNRAGQMDTAAISALASLDTNTFFKTVTFNGSFSSRRSAISTLVQSLKKKSHTR